VIQAIRARISRAYAALFALIVIAMSLFLGPQVAEARGGFSSGGRVSMSYSRSYSTVRIAPRVYVAPRPVVIVRPRPLIIAPRPYYRTPILVPYVAPQTYVDPNGQAQATVPVVASTGPSALEVLFWTVLAVIVISAVVGGCCYGYGYYAVTDPFDIFTDALIMDEILTVDSQFVDVYSEF
jgi:hypothetical protein